MNKLIEKLKHDICQIAEQAYRRGYQHGNLFSSEHGVTQGDCIQYRFYERYDMKIGCPERYRDGNVRMHNFGVDIRKVHLDIEIIRLLNEIESKMGE
jgi:hypothetical protein